MPDLSPIAPRLTRLILMLSSDQPGEVSAAAGMIGRTLAGAGATWHDLAAALTAPPAPPAPPPPPSAARPRSRPAPPSAERLRRACDLLLRHADLSAWETGFVSSIGEQLRAGRRLTSRQVAALAKVYAERAGAAL